jgi:hypothetical protein
MLSSFFVTKIYLKNNFNFKKKILEKTVYFLLIIGKLKILEDRKEARKSRLDRALKSMKRNNQIPICLKIH